MIVRSAEKGPRQLGRPPRSILKLVKMDSNSFIPIIG